MARTSPDMTFSYLLITSGVHLGDEFGVEIGFERIGAAFGPVTGILHTAERHFWERETEVIDRHHAALNRVAERRRGLGRARIGIGGKSVGETVRLGDGVVKLIECADDRDRSKRLLVHDPRAVRHVAEYRRLEEITLVADPAAAGFNLGALGNGVADEGFHSVETA